MKTREPTVMIEELMFFILHNEMNGELNPDHPFMTLYVELQKLLDRQNQKRYDLYVSVKNETLSNAVSKDDMSVAIYNDETK